VLKGGEAVQEMSLQLKTATLPGSMMAEFGTLTATRFLLIEMNYQAEYGTVKGLPREVQPAVAVQRKKATPATSLNC